MDERHPQRVSGGAKIRKSKRRGERIAAQDGELNSGSPAGEGPCCKEDNGEHMETCRGRASQAM